MCIVDSLGGRAVRVPARRGLILPLEWQLNDEGLIHYCLLYHSDAADERYRVEFGGRRSIQKQTRDLTDVSYRL